MTKSDRLILCFLSGAVFGVGASIAFPFIWRNWLDPFSDGKEYSYWELQHIFRENRQTFEELRDLMLAERTIQSFSLGDSLTETNHEKYPVGLRKIGALRISRPGGGLGRVEFIFYSAGLVPSSQSISIIWTEKLPTVGYDEAYVQLEENWYIEHILD